MLDPVNQVKEWCKVQKCFTKRMKVFIGVLVVTILITCLRPSLLINWFDSPGEMLGRLWTVASLVTTVIITFLVNREVVAENVGINVNDADWGQRIAEASSTNMMISGYCVIVIWLTAIPAVPLLVVQLLAGIGLVLLVMRFDWEMIGIKQVVLTKAESEVSPQGDQSALEKVKTDREAAAHVFFKLDLPILVGVCITFVVGQLFLPYSLDPGSATASMVQTFAQGFSAGSTALQIVVANLAYEIIRALASG
ncbi:MAG: hypothetical protein AAB403_02920 [Planctomycetota bacterium]